MQTLSVESWWLDERAHAGEEHLNAPYVAAYDRKAGFDATEDIEALKLQGLGGESIVLDLGAGTGTFAIAAARVCRRVVAVDVSPAMIEALRTRVEAAGLHNVTVVNAGFLSYEHHGEPADVIFTRNALHQIPDFWKAIALDRMASFLRPGGVLRLRDLVYDFDPAEADERIETWMADAVAEPSVGWTADELAHHVRSEFSTYRWLLEVMLDRAGFDIVDRAYRRSVYGTYTCRRSGS